MTFEWLVESVEVYSIRDITIHVQIILIIEDHRDKVTDGEWKGGGTSLHGNTMTSLRDYV